VVLVTGGYAPRMSWEFYDERRWLLVNAAQDDFEDDLASVTGRLEELGIERWTLVTTRVDRRGPEVVAERRGEEELPPAVVLGRWVAYPVGG
jgi:hypothetical protein